MTLCLFVKFVCLFCLRVFVCSHDNTHLAIFLHLHVVEQKTYLSLKATVVFSVHEQRVRGVQHGRGGEVVWRVGVGVGMLGEWREGGRLVETLQHLQLSGLQTHASSHASRLMEGRTQERQLLHLPLQKRHLALQVGDARVLGLQDGRDGAVARAQLVERLAVQGLLQLELQGL